jgi:hypothetical protein
MNARIIIPTSGGQLLSYDLRMRNIRAGGNSGLRIVFNTAEEPFERWLFYLLRDVGAHIVADNPAELRKVLGLSSTDAGIVAEREVTAHAEPIA